MNKMDELVILDLDGTIINGQSQVLFLKYLFKKNLVGLFFFIRVYAWFILYKFGLTTDPQAIMNYAFSFLKDKGIKEINKLAEEFFNDVLCQFIFGEMLDIIKKHKKEKRNLLIVSNSASFIVEHVAHYLGVRDFLSTQFEIYNEKFTGKILGNIVYGQNKANLVKEFCKKKNIRLENSYSYADSISDLNILLLSANPFPTNPDKKLLREANKRGWQVLIFEQ